MLLFDTSIGTSCITTEYILNSLPWKLGTPIIKSVSHMLVKEGSDNTIPAQVLLKSMNIVEIRPGICYISMIEKAEPFSAYPTSMSSTHGLGLRTPQGSFLDCSFWHWRTMHQPTMKVRSFWNFRIWSPPYRGIFILARTEAHRNSDVLCVFDIHQARVTAGNSFKFGSLGR